MSYLISKTDFPKYTTVSLNVADALINPYIGEAWEYLVEPLLHTAEVAALALPRAQWPAALEALFASYIEPVWVLEAHRRFVGMHGIHFTPDGIESLASDIGRAPITPSERARLGTDAQGKLSLRLGKLEAALRAYRGTTPSTCSPTRRRPSPGGLRIYTA